MPNDKSAPPPTRQEQREHAEPGESQTPIPLGIKLLVAVLIVWGIYYIANAPINVPSSLGDGRTVADLEKGKAGGGSGAADGAALFASRCAACHQAAGQGLPGVFPPLAGSEWVQGRPETVAAIVLHGIAGPLTVKGAKFNGAMPTFSDQLSDAEIAAVLSYVRSQWGNAAAPILAQAVTQVRDATKDAPRPTTVTTNSASSNGERAAGRPVAIGRSKGRACMNCRKRRPGTGSQARPRSRRACGPPASLAWRWASASSPRCPASPVACKCGRWTIAAAWRSPRAG